MRPSDAIVRRNVPYDAASDLAPGDDGRPTRRDRRGNRIDRDRHRGSLPRIERVFDREPLLPSGRGAQSGVSQNDSRILRSLSVASSEITEIWYANGCSPSACGAGSSRTPQAISNRGNSEASRALKTANVQSRSGSVSRHRAPGSPGNSTVSSRIPFRLQPTDKVPSSSATTMTLGLRIKGAIPFRDCSAPTPASPNRGITRPLHRRQRSPR